MYESHMPRTNFSSQKKLTQQHIPNVAHVMPSLRLQKKNLQKKHEFHNIPPAVHYVRSSPQQRKEALSSAVAQRSFFQFQASSSPKKHSLCIVAQTSPKKLFICAVAQRSFFEFQARSARSSPKKLFMCAVAQRSSNHSTSPSSHRSCPRCKSS